MMHLSWAQKVGLCTRPGERRAAAGGDAEPLLGSFLLRNTRKGLSHRAQLPALRVSFGSELESPDFFLSQPRCCPRNNRDS